MLAMGISQTTAFSTLHLVMFPAAHDYFEKAHRRATSLKTMDDVLAYYKLIATGTRCLETVLKERTQPYVECLAALWYCETLFAETNRYNVAEETLNKAIALAGRNNLLDIKFTMLHLSIRMLAKANVKAAQKLIKSCLKEAEITGIATWIYTFQYLRASYHFESREYCNVITALKPLFTCRSSEVRYLSLLTAAIVPLRQDNPAQAQAFLQEAGKCETEYSRKYVPQLVVMRAIYEVVSALMIGDCRGTEERLNALHQCLDSQDQDQNGRWQAWNSDGTFFIILPPGDDGAAYIPLSYKWWSQSEVYIVSCLLSGVVCVQNSWDKRKAIKYFGEGLRAIETESDSKPTAMTLQQAAERLEFYTMTRFFVSFYSCIERFVRGDWSADSLQSLVVAAEALPDDMVDEAHAMVLYVCALFFQARGKLRSALEAFELLRKSVASTSEFYILATMSMAVIFRGDVVRDLEKASILSSEIKPVIEGCSNKSIKLAWSVISAIDGSLSGLEMQNIIAGLLATARELENTQFTTIIMYLGASIFTDKGKRESSAMGAFLNAKKSRNVLWCWVAGNLSADLLENNGKELMAAKQRKVNDQLYGLVQSQLNSEITLV